MFDPLTLLAAIAPMASHAGGALIDIVKNKYAPDEIKPTNVDEFIQISDQRLKLFQSMNNVGGVSYPWVEAIIKLQRPLVVAIVSITWGYMHGMNYPDTAAIDNAAGIIGSYLFADRTLFYARKN
jgi:hypothetical protein